MLINFFIKIIDFIILVLNKLNNKTDSKKDINSENKEIFKINNLLKNDSLFEELENRYSNSSSLNGINSHNQSQNIFSSLKNKNKNKNNNRDYESDENRLDETSNFFHNIKEIIIYSLLNNKYIGINESNV